MNEALTLARRVMKLYLKNPASIVFSFVYTVLIIIMFAVFLGDYMANGMIYVYSGVQGVDLSAMRWLVDSTAMAGVLMINTISVPLNVLTIMVQDQNDGRLDSFLVSAVSRDRLVYGYWLAPFATSVLMNVICLFVAQGFVVLSGGHWLSITANLQMAGLIAANSFTSTGVLFLSAAFIRQPSTYNTFNGIIMALVGFVTGVFIPLGVFPGGVKALFAVLSVNHGATLMRQVMTDAPMRAVFGNALDQTVKDTFMSAGDIQGIYAAENGITILWGGEPVPPAVMLAVVLGTGIACAAASVLLMNRRKNK